jgi:hypothetical protein
MDQPPCGEEEEEDDAQNATRCGGGDMIAKQVQSEANAE